MLWLRCELPTVTDANVVLGYLDPDYFLGGKMKLSYEKAYNAIKKEVADKLNISVLDAAKGIVDLVNVNMANGIREMTIQRGGLRSFRSFQREGWSGTSSSNRTRIRHRFRVYPERILHFLCGRDVNVRY